MSVIEYGFGASSPAANAFVQTLFPSVSLVGTEIGGGFMQVVEVQGSLWFVNNAFWNTGLLGFQQSNALVPSSALVLAPSGSLTLLKAPANASPPIVWTATPIGSGGGGSLVSGTANPSTVPLVSANAFVQLLPANAARIAATVWNDMNRGTAPSAAAMFLAFGEIPGNVGESNFPVNAGQVVTIPAGYTGAIYAAATVPGGNGAQVVEYTT